MRRPDGGSNPVDGDSHTTWSTGQDSVRSSASWSEGDVRDLLARWPDVNETEVVAWLCNDQVRCWRAGQRRPAEAYLALHPELQTESDSAFELIYGEYLLRESLGDSPKLEEFLWRFPGFASRLKRQLSIHRALASDLEPTEPNLGPARPIPEPDEPDFELGPIVPGFKILGELGRGGMGVVYKARQLSLNRLVALKVIHAGTYANHEAGNRFRAEAEAVARFQHPNIVQIYEVGESRGLGYIALEYVAGGSLEQTLAGTPREPGGAAVLVQELARVIHSAHQQGIVHRDLKPANVVLTTEGVPKITDFGLAKLIEQDPDKKAPTLHGAILGTPSYMAPEQAHGGTAGPITPAVDIYALGAILYEMLAGRPPFKGSNPLSTLEQVTSQEPLPPGKFQRHVPRDLETICLKCLEKEPGRRYADALALAEDLRCYLEGRPIVARPASAWELAWKWARREPSAAIALVTVCTAVLVVLAGALYYNARLRTAVTAAQTSQKSAVKSAIAAQEQRNLALKALNQLVYGVQEKIAETPATRSLRRSLLDTAIAGLDEIARNAEESVPDLSRAVAHQKLGEIFAQIGRSEEALRQFDQARRLAGQLASISPQDPEIAGCLGKTHAGIGAVYLAAQQYDKAKPALRQVVDLARSVAALDPRGERPRQYLLEAYLQLGRVHSFAREFPEAELWFQEMRDQARLWLADDRQNRNAKHLLAASYRKLGDVNKLTDHYPEARGDYLEAIKIGRELLHDEPLNRPFKRSLGLALDDLAGVSHIQRDFVEARLLDQEAVELHRDLVREDPEDLDAQILLVHTLSNLGQLERDQKPPATAAGHFREALNILQRLEKEGRLEGRPGLKRETIETLKQEIANCETLRASRP